MTKLAALAALLSLAACAPTSTPVARSPLGYARSSADLEAIVDTPGPVTVETVIGADWVVPRAGLVNLDHPAAKAAGLRDAPEPIHIAFHALSHPERGLWLVDTGVERAFRADPEHALVSGLVGSVMHIDALRVRTDTASWIGAQQRPVLGVFLTHLHPDHITGLRDVTAGAPVYAGPGEAAERGFSHLFTRGLTDAALAGRGPLREWRFEADPAGELAAIDVFGDGAVWALLVPGHTAGSTAYLARTPRGPVLLTGDACHTTWGWDHGVEPGSFSSDLPRSADSLARLRRFAARHPGLDVRFGHQARVAPKPAPAVTGAQ